MSKRIATRKKLRPHRPTAAEKEARVSAVMTFLLSGSRRIEICQFASKTWGTTARQADRYIAEATQWIRDNAAKSREDQIIEHIGRMDFVFRSAQTMNDFTNAIKAAQDKAKLLGLYPTEKMRLDVYDWRDEARKAGINPDEALNEFERIIASKMATCHDDRGDTASEGAASVEAAPIADAASG